MEAKGNIYGFALMREERKLKGKERKLQRSDLGEGLLIRRE